MLWYAVASIGGCASYWVLRLAPHRIRDVAGNLSVCCIALACLTSAIIVIPIALLGVVQSLAGAFCEKAMDKAGGTWSSHFGISLLTYLLSIAVNFALLVLISQYLGQLLSLALDDDASLWGMSLGFLLTPAAISLFRWIVHNSNARPGIDRHLQEERATR